MKFETISLINDLTLVFLTYISDLGFFNINDYHLYLNFFYLEFLLNFNLTYSFLNNLTLANGKNIINKSFIWKTLRLYIYIATTIYIITLIFVLIFIVFKLEKGILICKILIHTSNFLMHPIFKIKNLVLYLLTLFKKVTKYLGSIIKEEIIKRTTKPKNECSDKDEKISPNFGRTTPLTPTQGELNCMGNKFGKNEILLSKAYEVKKYSEITKNPKAAMFIFNNEYNTYKDDKKNYIPFISNITKVKKDMDIINNTHGCPNFHEFAKGNQKFEK